MRARGAADGEKITANRAAEIALRFLQCYPDSHSVFDNGGLERLRLDEAEYVDMAQFTEKEQQRIDEERRRLPEAIAGMQREWDMRRLG